MSLVIVLWAELLKNKMGELPAMSKFKNSMILMGINWSKAAKTKAFKDIKTESPRIAGIMTELDRFYRIKN